MIVDPESLAVIGGAIALAGGVTGSSIGIALAASSGLPILADDPKQLRNVIILASLPMTQTFYGLIILVLTLTVVAPGIAGMNDPGGLGFAALGIGVIGALAESISALYQGVICASGISLLSKTKGRILTNSILMAVLVELLGVFGLVFTLMAWTMLGIM